MNSLDPPPTKMQARPVPGPPTQAHEANAEDVTAAATLTVTLTRRQIQALIYAAEYQGIQSWIHDVENTALMGAVGILRSHLEGKAP
jgi:hypothetical protein